MSLSLAPLLKQLTIKTKGNELRPFDLSFRDPELGDLGWAQRRFSTEVERQYNDGKPVRIITLKARQLGISTITEAILFWWTFLHPGTNGLVVAHENTPSLELFNMTKLYWDTWPHRALFTLKYQTKQQLAWLETRSQLRIATAKNVQSGRGSTIQAAHLSEAAFYLDAEGLMTGLRQTIPNRHGSIIVIESTANGVGNWFYNMWKAAEEGESEFVPLFFPWWRHPEYVMPTTLTETSHLDSEERKLLKLGATFPHIAWRRYAITNLAHGDLDFFMQEYPSTPEEAFISTGRPVFSHKALRECYYKQRGHRGLLLDTPNSKVRWVHDPDGPLTIFKKPVEGDTRTDRYMVSGDPSQVVHGDPACIQVLNRQNWEQVAVWHGRADPIHFADEMIRVGKFYNNAMLCPEAYGGGQAAVARMISRNYPNIWMFRHMDRIPRNFNAYGWATNYERKLGAIGWVQRFLVDHTLKLHDARTYHQMRDYINKDGGMENADPRGHDDAVMALAIAVAATQSEGPFMADQPTGDIMVDLFRQEFDNEAAYR